MANAWAAVVVGFVTLARPLELIELKRSHLTVAGAYFVLHITPKKKAPGAHAVPIPIAPGDGGGSDAFAALLRLEQTDPVPAHLRATTPLFRLDTRALTHLDITRIVRAVVTAAGEHQRASTFSGRSMRVGGATEAAIRGADPATLKSLGRWDSSVYTAYTRASRGQALQHAAALARTARDADPALEALFAGYSQTV